MSGNYLLDTNIIIALWKPDQNIVTRLTGTNVTLSCIAAGELLFGAFRSRQVDSNVKRIEEFVLANRVLRCDSYTAFHYGRIKSDLLAKGRPIPENDIWIAAHALQYDLILVSRDHHFNEIDGLNIEIW